MLTIGTYYSLTLYWKQDWITTGPEAMNKNLIKRLGK